MKKTAFEIFLGEDAQKFSDLSRVISAKRTSKEFYDSMCSCRYGFATEISFERFEKFVEKDRVHFHMDIDEDGEKANRWRLGSKGMRGAKEVLVFNNF